MKNQSPEVQKKKRGYFGIAFYEPKFEENIGTAVRNAHCFGADFIAVIGKRYKKQPSDTMKTEKHVPIYEYSDLKDFIEHLPKGCEIVVVECDGESSIEFKHPQRAVYLMGGEDRSVPKTVNAKRVAFPTSHCVNMAVASGLILYDRVMKQ
jgi:tRNA(Leu) C34 or U34 (ribose-2'-O)-methylase TrmL